MTHERNATQWTILGERVVDETRRLRLSIADVELPDGVKFEQYVLRMPPAAMMVVIDDRDRVVMAWRHRFIIDRWVWELPGGYVDPGEDPATCAIREFEEETGWKPVEARPLVTCQPIVGSADAANLLFVSYGAEYVGHPPDINEAERVEWIPLDSVRGLIDEGKIVGSSSIIGLLMVLGTARP